MTDLKAKLKLLPDKPGVYIMKDSLGNIIYVGKAKSLKKRVSQYFGSYGQGTLKVKSMVEHISDFEYIVVNTEVESLILESNLIKENNPKYNILLRDDKQYPYIKITMWEKYPRILKVRSVLKDKGKYFGPYPSAENVNVAIDIFQELFPIRDCNLNLEKAKGKVRPCLNFFIDRCMAPCYENVSEEDYRYYIDKVIDFLEGRSREIPKIIEQKMDEASLNLNFEKAADLRDKLNSLNYLVQRGQLADTASFENRDVIGVAQGDGEAAVQIFFVRNGKITGRENFFIKDEFMEKREDLIQAFIKQFYVLAAFIPGEILVEVPLPDAPLLEVWLSGQKGSKVEILVPKIGEKKHLVDLVKKNAGEMLLKSVESMRRQRERNLETLEEVQRLLNLDVLPKRIEAYDISNISGVDSVGSMVVFENGERKKSDYRKFRIKTVEGPNDYDSLREVLKRRFTRGIKEQQEEKYTTFSLYPDLILMDGGKGQVNAALEVLESIGVTIPVAGLVKDDFHQTRGVIYENEEKYLKVTSNVYRFFYKIQEEAHRFAINYHRSLRTKNMFTSELDNIKGIGPKRKANLMRHFNSISKIKSASVEELLEVKGMNRSAAESIVNHFNRSGNGNSK